MRDDDRIRLRHMIEAAETVGVFVGGRQRSDLDEDRMLLFAVLRAIEVFGEAASKMSEEVRAGAPEIPWRMIVAMRNRLIHGYFDVDTELVWQTATAEIPSLIPLLRAIASPTGETQP